MAPVPPPAVPPIPTMIGSPLASTTILDRYALFVPAFVVSQGPMEVPLSLAPMMNDCPLVPLVVVALQGLSWVPETAPICQSVVLSAPIVAVLATYVVRMVAIVAFSATCATTPLNPL